MNIQPGQTIFDMAILIYGTIEGVEWICMDNNLSYSDELVAGSDLVVREDMLQKSVVDYFDKKQLSIATNDNNYIGGRSIVFVITKPEDPPVVNSINSLPSNLPGSLGTAPEPVIDVHVVNSLPTYLPLALGDPKGRMTFNVDYEDDDTITVYHNEELLYRGFDFEAKDNKTVVLFEGVQVRDEIRIVIR